MATAGGSWSETKKGLVAVRVGAGEGTGEEEGLGRRRGWRGGRGGEGLEVGIRLHPGLLESAKQAGGLREVGRAAGSGRMGATREPGA